MRRLTVLVLLLAACGPARVREPVPRVLERDADAGAVDAGPSDLDAGAHDAGTQSPLDAGSIEDAGALDAGPEDAGPIDAGPEDAGPIDSGPIVSGPIDSGPIDAGLPELDAGPPSTRQTARPLGSTSAPNGFYEYLPPSYGDGVPRPLMVFWHGIGEDGNGTTDLYKVLNNGPPKKIANDTWSNDMPFVVLSPQNPGSGCPSSGEISDFINWARATYDVDPHRTYLTGLSCGAIGSWAYLGDHFADGGIAAALLSSGDPGDPTQSWSAWGKGGCSLGQVAIWAVHGDADPIVNIANEQATMNDLLACPSPPRRDVVWTVVPGGGHDVWDAMYDGAYGDVYGWLLANPLP